MCFGKKETGIDVGDRNLIEIEFLDCFVFTKSTGAESAETGLSSLTGAGCNGTSSVPTGNVESFLFNWTSGVETG